MRAAGFGLCAREEGVFRLARTFSAAAPCGKKQFQPADAAKLAAREKALAKVQP